MDKACLKGMLWSYCIGSKDWMGEMQGKSEGTSTRASKQAPTWYSNTTTSKSLYGLPNPDLFQRLDTSGSWDSFTALVCLQICLAFFFTKNMDTWKTKTVLWSGEAHFKALGKGVWPAKLVLIVILLLRLNWSIWYTETEKIGLCCNFQFCHKNPLLVGGPR